ncbi:MAG: DUF502 domain-containing protein [Flavobacteriales bacterium]|nr:DUF502 domain-containing protein [Flavobacteriales bacterium]
MKKIISYFLQGLLYTAPMAITVYAVIIAVQFLDHLLPMDIPGVGIAILLTSITLIGYFTTSYLAQSLIERMENLLTRTPLIKLIYTSIKDLLAAFVGKEKRFDQPVLVKVSKDSALHKLGFITQSDLSALNIDGNMVAVYLPHSYAFSGNLFIVPSEQVTIVSANPAQVMKFIVSGGVSGYDELVDKPSDTATSTKK